MKEKTAGGHDDEGAESTQRRGALELLLLVLFFVEVAGLDRGAGPAALAPGPGVLRAATAGAWLD